jgi:hypothetical protein
MENKIETTRLEKPPTYTSNPANQDTSQQRKTIIIISVSAFIILVLLFGVIYVLALPTTDTARIRDIFIIFMALTSLLLIASLAILIIQIARLTNLLQNEIKPILASTSETIDTLRGTTEFLSDNLVEPVIKLNEYVAALQQLFGLLNLSRKRNQSKSSTTQ